MNRAAARAAIFTADVDKQQFLDCVAEAFEIHGVQLHAYCLMTTHYHLLVRSTVSRLSDAMRFASGKFTKLKNKRDGRDGPLFRGRITSVAIDSDAHLIQAMRYIHMNPVEAGIVAQPTDWDWSSVRAYLDAIARPTRLETAFILDMFGPANPVEAFRRHLAAGVDASTREFYARL